MKTHVIEKNRMHNGDRDYEALSYVITAASTDKKRPQLHGVRIDTGLAVSTDGFRLHMACLETEIPDGYYDVKKAAKMIVLTLNDEVTFPDYDMLFRRMNTPEYVKSEYCNGDASKFVFEVYNTGVFFNLEYLTDAYIPNRRVHMEIRDHNRPMVIHDDEYERAAMVMPKKLA